MTKKDFKIIAAGLHATYVACDNADQRGAVLAAMTLISVRIKAANPRFDAGKFAEAVVKGEGL